MWKEKIKCEEVACPECSNIFLFKDGSLSFSMHMWSTLYQVWCHRSERHGEHTLVWFSCLQFFHSVAQSCEDLNKQELDYQCEWRYNSCGPACPVTCQHPQPLECPVQCVEGCHVHCPAGKSIFCFKQWFTFFHYAQSLFFFNPLSVPTAWKEVLQSRNIHRFVRLEISKDLEEAVNSSTGLPMCFSPQFVIA